MYIYKAAEYIPQGLSLSVFRERCKRQMPAHSHDFIEIVYVEQGQALQYVADRSYTVRRGDLLFINCGSEHRFVPQDEFTYINICLLPDLIGRRVSNPRGAFDLLTLTAFEELQAEQGSEGLVVFRGRERQSMEMLLSDMLEEYRSGLPDRHTVLESYIRIIIARILRKLLPQPTGTPSGDALWRDLFAYIDRNLDRKLTLAALAKICFYNPAYFGRMFRETFHMTLPEYIEQERLALAARLLKETSLKTEEIAARCGFGDRTVLYRTFTRVYGCTPADYRAGTGTQMQQEPARVHLPFSSASDKL